MVKEKQIVSFQSVLPAKAVVTEPAVNKDADPVATENSEVSSTTPAHSSPTANKKAIKKTSGDTSDVFKTIAVRLSKAEYDDVRRYQYESELAGKPPASLAMLAKTALLKQAKKGSSNV